MLSKTSSTLKEKSYRKSTYTKRIFKITPLLSPDKVVCLEKAERCSVVGMDGVSEINC